MTIAEQFKDLINSRSVAFDAKSVQSFHLSGIVPSCILKPRSIEEISQWLTAAYQKHAKVHIWGAGNHQHIGGIGENPDFVLVMNQLNSLVEFSPNDMTVTAQAGMTLGELQNIVKKHKLSLPLDPPTSTNATLGGIVASNMYGPRSQRFGTARDMVLGIKAVLANGSIIKSGGKTVKNVAGYDLCKLFIGSFGTLGAITELTFKLWPLPEESAALRIDCVNSDQADTLAKAMIRSQINISGLIYQIEGKPQTGQLKNHSQSLTVIFDDKKKSIQNTISEINQLNQLTAPQAKSSFMSLSKTITPSFVEQTFETALSDRENDYLILKAIVPKSKIFELNNSVRHYMLKDQYQFQIVSYCGLGVSYVVFHALPSSSLDGIIDLVQTARVKAQHLGGSLLVEKAPQQIKAKIDVWGINDKVLQWMRNIKNEFDPNGVFTSGRFVGGI